MGGGDGEGSTKSCEELVESDAGGSEDCVGWLVVELAGAGQKVGVDRVGQYSEGVGQCTEGVHGFCPYGASACVDKDIKVR